MIVSQPIFAPGQHAPSCHAATVVALEDGQLLAAWFAGTHEGHPDVGVWMARFDGTTWGTPFQILSEPGVPLWNPVLFSTGPDALWLFYKVAPTIPAWTGLYIKSEDGGHTWSAPTALPAGLLGPAKNKPLLLSNGDILSGTSAETWRSWACWVEISHNGGQSWTKHGPLAAPGGTAGGKPDNTSSGASAGTPGGEPTSATWDTQSHSLVLPQERYGIIQPTVWESAPGRLTMLMRATQRVGFVCRAESNDYGRTWSEVTPTEIPCPNSGLDAVRLHDGRVVLICNPSHTDRSPLSLLASADNGATWPWRLDLETEPGEYSYPSIIQAPDGRIHSVYTHQRTSIRHVMLDPEDIELD